ncbi:roadblock/LC7 domain-containing protein [Dyella acidiphila]|uniref:Roadblock/LC7 domain-containing protein n=1 Tax=Dyella acidiphila TaxID=2775866 RepID=A0ABR9GCU9_9GAMM|nr:roadblock/LC7 domain-containing protein [Dyella acidiphila]MBE1161866.1 roadblock/LC7 domain-containing protein [Dyella acidiphila]
MATFSLDSLRGIDGYIASALVDADSGMLMAGDSNAGIDLDLAAAGNAEVVRAKRRVAEALKLGEAIEDILISLERQYHLIRPLESNKNVFLYVIIDRQRSNLAMARHHLKGFEKSLDFS